MIGEALKANADESADAEDDANDDADDFFGE
jgi:hypothetical protein